MKLTKKQLTVLQKIVGRSRPDMTKPSRRLWLVFIPARSILP